MKTFLDAIYAKFVASTTLYDSVDERMYLGEAPAGTDFPHIIYGIDSWVQERTLDKKYPICRLNFTIYSDAVSGIEAQTIFGYLDDVFGSDNLSLTIASVYRFVRMDLENCILDRVPGSEKGGKNLWQIPVDYMVYLEKL